MRTAAVYYFLAAIVVLLIAFDTFFALPLLVSAFADDVTTCGFKLYHRNHKYGKEVWFEAHAQGHLGCCLTFACDYSNVGWFPGEEEAGNQFVTLLGLMISSYKFQQRFCFS